LNYNFNIATINQCTESEGPFKRLAIWFQGCNLQCKECCNPKLFTFKQANIVSLDAMIEIIIEAKSNFGIEGVTYLGGEPTLQQGLSELSKRLNQLDFGVLLFTGNLYEELPKELIENVDLIIDGQFEKENIDNERNLIGSKNQRLICISDRYKNDLDWFDIPRSKIGEINVSENLIVTGDVILK
jgi:anaerobic ribonucleoside-triphosphate reductase activating protein